MRLGHKATYFINMRKLVFRMAILSLTLFMFMPIAAQQDSTIVKHRGTKSENRRHGKHIDKKLELDEVVVVADGVSRVKK